MERDSFVFYRSFYEAIKELPSECKAEVMSAIIEYGLDGKLPDDIKGIAKAVMMLIVPQLDANNQKYRNGKMGGRPRNQDNSEPKPNENQDETKTEPNENQAETETKPKQNQTETKTKPNGNQTATEPKPNENVNVNVNVNDIKKECIEKKGEPSSPTRTTFKKPSLQEIEDYVRANNLNVDCNKFFDYYESCGWRVGNKMMRNWQATARNWSRTENERKPEESQKQQQQGNNGGLYRNPEQDAYDKSEF